MVALSDTLRYDEVPLEDFLVSLAQHEQDVRPGFLPRASSLKEVLFSGVLGDPGGPKVRLFVLQEMEALSQVTETFLVLAGPGDASALLAETGLALAAFLRSRGEPAMFRIDPRYGLVCGSAQEPVDPGVKWGRPAAYLTLYLTDDPGSPSLALMEYVPAEHQKTFCDLFQRYNGVQPKKPSFFGGALKRLAGAPPPAPAARVNYRLVKGLAQFLGTRRVSGPTVSLIFKGITAEELPSCLLDSGRLVPSPSDRFLPSLGDLA